MKRSALIVGIDNYHDSQIQNLKCAENDCAKLAGFLEFAANYDDVKMLHGFNATNEKILDSAVEMVNQLDEDDLFLFFFSGHGTEHNGKHLLLCPNVKYSRLEFMQQVVPIDLLKRETESKKLNRVFILDACRSNLLNARAAKPEGLKGEQILRDIVARPSTSRQNNGSLAVLCSCEENSQAAEIPGCGQGLFSAAFLDVLNSGVQASADIALTDSLESDIAEKMYQLARKHGLPQNQQPWIQRSGPPPVILGSKIIVNSSKKNESPKPNELKLHVCPICGRRNEEKDTFKCVKCGKDYLCLAHFDKKLRCCEDCAEKIIDEQKAEEEKQREAKAEQQRKAETERKERKKYIPKFGKELVIEDIELLGIEPGQFRMGDIHGDGEDDEKPVHTVNIRKSFWMGKYPVTQKQWKDIMGNNPSDFKGDNLPVETVSWNDCKSFCEKLSQKTGLEFRLPSESEWEYACRAGTTTKYYTGNDESDLDRAGWYDDNSNDQTYPVGRKSPNNFGLYDMHGNVWEWCEDIWHDDYVGAPNDGNPWLNGGNSSFRVLRGGSWYHSARNCRAAFRFFNSPESTSFNYGFRVVLAFL